MFDILMAMKIDGKAIAEGMLGNLVVEVNAFKKHGVTPTLAVVMIGDNPASLAYIKQKQKAAERIGARIVVSHQSSDVRQKDVKKLIEEFNEDHNIHGIIVQRPLPSTLRDAGGAINMISLYKDVDGFESNSPFDVPVAMAVWEILQSISNTQSPIHNFVVIGRGEAAGAPIARYLTKRDCTTLVIHSKTPNPQEIMKQADCIISCVGKERVVTADAVKPGAILISVGLWRDEAGKLRGDYDEAEIESIASYYTPTPGGVGPVNVACLMHNLVRAATSYPTNF